MTRSISLAAFFILILAGVFWITQAKVAGDRSGSDSLLRMLTPRVQVMTPEREGGPTKFQLAISTDPSPMNQMNREAISVATRVRPAVVLVTIAYKEDPSARNRKKGTPGKTPEWVSNGVLIGNGNEILAVIPMEIVPGDIHVRFQDGSEGKADFVGRDDATQIALLRLPQVATAKPLAWRNRRSMEWGEHFFVLDWDAVQGSQMARVMVSGDAVLPSPIGRGALQRYHQLDQVLSNDFLGAVLVDGSGDVAGLVIQPDAPEQLRALVLDAGSVRVAAEALRSLEKKE